MARTRLVDPVQQVRDGMQRAVGVLGVSEVERARREVARFVGDESGPRVMLTDVLPDVDNQYYGWLVIVNGGLGVADAAWVLLRTAGDVLTWVRIDSTSGGGTPTIAPAGAHVSAANVDASSTDRNASVNWTTGAVPGAGVQVAVTFGSPLGTTNYAVSLTATEDDAAVRNLYATAKGSAGFQIAVQSTPVANRFHSCDYLISLR